MKVRIRSTYNADTKIIYIPEYLHTYIDRTKAWVNLHEEYRQKGSTFQEARNAIEKLKKSLHEPEGEVIYEEDV